MESPDVVALFEACDANGDAKIDYTEFIAAAVEKTVLMSNENLRMAFNLIDTDGNGEISKEELKSVFGGGAVSSRPEEIWDQIMDEVDDNNDGVIAFEEFETAMRSIVKKRSSIYTEAMPTRAE